MVSIQEGKHRSKVCRYRGRGLISLLSCGVLGLLLANPVVAGRSVANKLVKAERVLVSAERRAEKGSMEYTQRRGLLGALEAEQRYEDAVYRFMIEDYEKAALNFHTLVESSALTSVEYSQDADWYLAESLFELRNYVSAVAAYERILDEGPSHLFFDDAVRRQLEIFGIIHDNDKFYEVYKAYILSGRVTATDEVKYTVAKSFYRQAEIVRAKSMFAEMGPESSMFGRSRYFLGTILAAEGEFQAAISEFETVAALEESENSEVVELAWLALGRLYYETEDYEKATDYYQRIGSRSDYFVDQLYELVWTYIKREQWEDALRYVEIFLIAFPEHHNALKLKLHQGDLHMKAAAYEKALAAYDSVVREYMPVHGRVAGMSTDRARVKDFLERLINEDVFKASDFDLPDYAVDLLINDNAVGRVVSAKRELRRQDTELDDASVLVDEISGILRAENPGIGTFGRGRMEVRRVSDDGLLVRSLLVDLEIDYLAENSHESKVDAVLAFRPLWEMLRERTDEVITLETKRADELQAYNEQVRNVQRQAFDLARVSKDLETQRSATRLILEEQGENLSKKERLEVEAGLAKLERELEEIKAKLAQVQSAGTRQSILDDIPEVRAEDTDKQRNLIASDYEELHDDLAGYRASIVDAGASSFFTSTSDMWERVERLDNVANTTLTKLNAAEKIELGVVRKLLEQERKSVVGLISDVSETGAETEVLSYDIAETGLTKLEDELQDSIMNADRGIVDVYWVRKIEVADEMTRLSKERGMRRQELEDRFELIHQKVEE